MKFPGGIAGLLVCVTPFASTALGVATAENAAKAAHPSEFTLDRRATTNERRKPYSSDERLKRYGKEVKEHFEKEAVKHGAEEALHHTAPKAPKTWLGRAWSKAVVWVGAVPIVMLIVESIRDRFRHRPGPDDLRIPDDESTAGSQSNASSAAQAQRETK
jgi:hypothetical protein